MDRHLIKKLILGDFSYQRLIISISVIYLFFLLFAVFLSEWLIFRPQSPSYPSDPGIIKLPVGGGDFICAKYYPVPGSFFTILYSHGNAEDLGDVDYVMNEFNRHGYSMFCYDYRGYGRSDGRPSEKACYEDVMAAYGYLVTELKVPPERIIIFGRSVGGAPSLELASRKPAAGLILEAAFATAFSVVLPFPVFPFDRMRNVSKIPKIKMPVLIMHGTSDEVIPFSHSKKLFDAATDPKSYYVIKGANHNNLMLVAGDDYWKKIDEFARTLKTGY